ncbi:MULTISPECIES: hypothetical protein [Legionella]|uniref:Leucine-rich repeat-containing protein (Substrate of the Dot/Icm secretion system) n=1 Tax=Legionella maceachernii TaxID=466 RepID=A0A0W0VY99_9GAMM|nr:hypothetical protein [Legionella maceachernii]KTD25084.1 leucine-rich repeat-containing protein (substrate of the Dot/Icm secretion system) [Legionella maceachernii]SJZ51777.1 hypothetical protein SAMN02745128_00338 [Legionella maceachernii]SUP03653.1 Uncharacterised protein [Legionella maceachernii]
MQLVFAPNQHSGEEFIQSFQKIKNISPPVTELVMWLDGFDSRSTTELGDAFAAIPSSVTRLCCAGNIFSINEETLAKIFASIPKSVTLIELDLSESILSIDNLSIENIQQLANSLPNIDFYFRESELKAMSIEQRQTDLARENRTHC